MLSETQTSPTADTDALYEVVRGQRVEVPPMSAYAVWIASRLHLRLGGFVEENQLGNVAVEGLFILDEVEDIRRRPDLAYVSNERWPLDRPISHTGDWPVVPDLAIEVISPHDRYEAVLEKMEEYFRYQVKQVWLVVPLVRKVYVYDSPANVRILTDQDQLDRVLVPGFSLKLDDLFQKQA